MATTRYKHPHSSPIYFPHTLFADIRYCPDAKGLVRDGKRIYEPSWPFPNRRVSYKQYHYSERQLVWYLHTGMYPVRIRHVCDDPDDARFECLTISPDVNVRVPYIFTGLPTSENCVLVDRPIYSARKGGLVPYKRMPEPVRDLLYPHYYLVS